MSSSEKEVSDIHIKTVLDGAALVAMQEQRPPTDDGILRLSPAQERIWFLEEMEPGNPLNLLFFIFQLSGKLNDEKLRMAFEEVVRRQQILRTTFAAAAIYAGIDGRPMPIIAEATPFVLPKFDLAQLSSSAREAEVANLTKLARHEPFDLSKGPLFRTNLLKLSDDQHLLLLSVHRMIADEMSCLILISELRRLYESFTANTPLDLEPHTFPYSTLANRQLAWLQTDAAQKRINDAKELLRGAPGLLELPTDKPRPAKRSYKGARVSIDVPGHVADAAKQLGERVGSNSSGVLLTAFQTLLARYTSQPEIVLGIPVSGRTLETESVIGPLSNSVVLRTKIVSEGSFLEQLERTSESLAEALSLQDVPFERLVDELDPQRSLSHTPIYQVMFRPDDSAPLKYDSAHFSRLDCGTEVCEFDLSLSLRLPPRNEEPLKVTCDYNTDLFNAGTIERLLKNFMCLLEGVGANPEQPLSALQLIHPDERQQLISWNETEQEYEREVGVQELIERQAELRSGEVALVCGAEELSYGELNGRANQLAAYLRGRLGGESLVGVYLERGVELVIAVLAVLKAGAAYVPLAPEQPAARLGYMIADAGLALLITQPHLRERLPGEALAGVAVVSLAEEAAAIGVASTENVRGSGGGRRLAYVIYTSGSTGAPKAVEIEHGAVVNFLQAMGRRPGLGVGDRLLAVTTISFDIAALELYLPLVVGGSVELTSRAEAADGQYLKGKLGQGRITALQATPATWRMLVEAGWAGSERVKIMCGGEALPRELANALLERGLAVWNMYGPTETTIWSAVGELREREGPVLLGEPIANTQLYVLDEALQLVPLGVAGELYIGGAGLARGYHGRAALTAERFLPNPYAGVGGARMYRTGDLVRRQADGRLEFLGRLDHQVKIRGFRIEIGEIESLLRQHPAVRDTVVVVSEDSSEKRLVAYLVLQLTQTVAPDQLRAHLQQSLPDYMIPSAFVVLDELPLSVSGKVDRRRLPQPNDERPALAESFVAPRTPVEQEIARIWEQVLKVRNVGVFDDFFALGGHSLLATQVISRIKESLQIDMPLRVMFEQPTVARFALAAAQHQALTAEAETMQLLDELAQLSDEEAQRLLDSEMFKPD